jgi:hypothetical protein
VISLEFNFLEFISAIKDRDKHDILRLAESEATEAEKISEIKGYGQNYVEAVREFIYFLRYSQKPDGIKEEHFQMFQSVCEKLVAKKQLLPDVMKMFDPNE